jgi:hypothetical protein
MPLIEKLPGNGLENREVIRARLRQPYGQLREEHDVWTPSAIVSILGTDRAENGNTLTDEARTDRYPHVIAHGFVDAIRPLNFHRLYTPDAGIAVCEAGLNCAHILPLL